MSPSMAAWWIALTEFPIRKGLLLKGVKQVAPGTTRKQSSEGGKGVGSAPGVKVAEV